MFKAITWFSPRNRLHLVPMHLFVTRINWLLCIDVLWSTGCTLVITSRAGEWDKDLVDCIVNETANAERQLSQARNKSSIAMMVKIQTIFLAILLNGIPKFTKQRKLAQNSLMPKDTGIARIEVQLQPVVSLWPTSVISAKVMVDDHLLSHASFNPCQRV